MMTNFAAPLYWHTSRSNDRASIPVGLLGLDVSIFGRVTVANIAYSIIMSRIFCGIEGTEMSS